MKAAQRGTTLIEAMAALAVFTIGILGVLQMNVLASSQSNLASQQTTATTIARDMVDAFERLPYDHPAFSVSSTPWTDPQFVDSVGNLGGLHDLATTSDFSVSRPIASSTPAISALEQKTSDVAPYRVTWRVGAEMDPTNPLVEQARRIAVMVTYSTPAGTRQVTVWTVKANLAAVTGASAGPVPEI